MSHLVTWLLVLVVEAIKLGTNANGPVASESSQATSVDGLVLGTSYQRLLPLVR